MERMERMERWTGIGIRVTMEGRMAGRDSRSAERLSND
jgi:hypothetical protein